MSVILQPLPHLLYYNEFRKILVSAKFIEDLEQFILSINIGLERTLDILLKPVIQQANYLLESLKKIIDKEVYFISIDHEVNELISKTNESNNQITEIFSNLKELIEEKNQFFSLHADKPFENILNILNLSKYLWNLKFCLEDTKENLMRAYRDIEIEIKAASETENETETETETEILNNQLDEISTLTELIDDIISLVSHNEIEKTFQFLYRDFNILLKKAIKMNDDIWNRDFIEFKKRYFLKNKENEALSAPLQASKLNKDVFAIIFAHMLASCENISEAIKLVKSLSSVHPLIHTFIKSDRGIHLLREHFTNTHITDTEIKKLDSELIKLINKKSPFLFSILVQSLANVQIQRVLDVYYCPVSPDAEIKPSVTYYTLNINRLLFEAIKANNLDAFKLISQEYIKRNIDFNSIILENDLCDMHLLEAVVFFQKLDTLNYLLEFNDNKINVNQNFTHEVDGLITALGIAMERPSSETSQALINLLIKAGANKEEALNQVINSKLYEKSENYTLLFTDGFKVNPTLLTLAIDKQCSPNFIEFLKKNADLIELDKHDNQVADISITTEEAPSLIDPITTQADHLNNLTQMPTTEAISDNDQLPESPTTPQKGSVDIISEENETAYRTDTETKNFQTEMKDPSSLDVSITIEEAPLSIDQITIQADHLDNSTQTPTTTAISDNVELPESPTTSLDVSVDIIPEKNETAYCTGELAPSIPSPTEKTAPTPPSQSEASSITFVIPEQEEHSSYQNNMENNKNESNTLNTPEAITVSTQKTNDVNQNESRGISQPNKDNPQSEPFNFETYLEPIQTALEAYINMDRKKHHPNLFVRHFDNGRGLNRANVYYELLKNTKETVKQAYIILALLNSSEGPTLKKTILNELIAKKIDIKTFQDNLYELIKTNENNKSLSNINYTICAIQEHANNPHSIKFDLPKNIWDGQTIPNEKLRHLGRIIL